MMDKLKTLFLKYREPLAYLFFGGCTTPVSYTHLPPEDLHLADIFGPGSPRGTQEDLFTLLAAARPETLPFFRIYTGTEDFLYGDILRLARALEEKGAGCALETTPGLHRWATWEPFLADVAARLGAHLA